MGSILPWVYQNAPHKTTGQKPFSAVWYIFKDAMRRALCSITPMHHVEVEDYRKELILSLSLARELAVASQHKKTPEEI